MQRILLVEDNEMNRDLISRKLVRRGFEVSLAVDGAAGVEATVRERPDLVLMDIGLPVLDGYEATRLIKENPEVQHIPVVGLSAHAMSGDSEKAMAAGCDDYDTKPIEWPRLLGKIQTLLERAASRTEGASAPGQTESAPTSAERHVLLVHESPLHREMLAGRLAGHEYGLVTASSAREALDRLDERDWDAVLVDIGLSDVQDRSGLEALRAHPRGSDLPLLLLAPVDRAQDASSLLGEVADEMILQPFRPEELLHRLGRLLGEGVEGSGSSGGSPDLALERRRADHLVRAVIPSRWVERLRQEHRLPPRQIEGVSVLSIDLPELASFLDREGPVDGLRILQALLVAFEDTAEKHGLFASGLTGNAATFSAGAHTGCDTPRPSAARAALEMLAAVHRQGRGLTLRAGLHHGSASAAVVGRRAVRFGLWGPAVTVAERIRNSGRQAIFASEAVWRQLGDGVRGERVGELPATSSSGNAASESVGGAGIPVYRLDALGD